MKEYKKKSYVFSKGKICIANSTSKNDLVISFPGGEKKLISERVGAVAKFLARQGALSQQITSNLGDT